MVHVLVVGPSHSYTLIVIVTREYMAHRRRCRKLSLPVAGVLHNAQRYGILVYGAQRIAGRTGPHRPRRIGMAKKCEACGGSGLLVGSVGRDRKKFTIVRVERCDTCLLFGDDEAAADALRHAYGTATPRRPLPC